MVLRVEMKAFQIQSSKHYEGVEIDISCQVARKQYSLGFFTMRTL